MYSSIVCDFFNNLGLKVVLILFKTLMAKFEIYKVRIGEFRFRLKAGNGLDIFASECYAAKLCSTNGIESIRKLQLMIQEMNA